MTTPSQASPAAVAAFDVDGTLTRRDTFLPFLIGVVRGRLAVTLVGHPIRLARAAARRDRDELKHLTCSALAGMPADRMRERGTAYAHEIVSRRLRPDTVARLRRHRELGHRVVLVSASLDAYLDPLGELLGVDGVLCTRLAVDGEGRLTGRLDGANCRGPEKARRLRAWLAEAGVEGAELWAYGDSSGDDALLAAADHPMRVDGIDLTPDLPRAGVVG